MLAKIMSSAVNGVDGLMVEVEVDIAFGLPTFTTVGLPEGAVKESKERVKAAVKNSGYEFPPRRITVNLAPANLKKVGTGYDLPIALGILAASGTLKSEILDQYAAIGELSLDGGLRSTQGILPMVLAARSNGRRGVIVPHDNAHEAAVVSGIEVIDVATLPEAVEFLNGQKSIEPTLVDIPLLFKEDLTHQEDFLEVKGQAHVKRALEVAAAGGHNVLMKGPPGSGKTMVSRRLPTILPDLSFDEALETTKIYSVMGLLPDNKSLLTSRPFRAPHHTISDAGLIGGGQLPRPGEVSLAHNGILFLDELPEFKKNVLEVMRQPLEDGTVTIARAAHSISFPSKFILIAAMNPCPCGYLDSEIHDCTCTPVQVQRYQSRLSGPLLDRIDIHLEVPAVPYSDMSDTQPGEPSRAIKQRVMKARQIQAERYRKRKNITCNTHMSSRDIKKYCALDDDSQKLLEMAVHKLGLSARAYNRILKLARTIADLDESREINSSHVAEAVQYRRMNSRGQN